MKLKEKVLSTDGETYLNYVTWLPSTEKPKAVLQLVHGMAEYIERYDDFAHYLNKNNILVVGHDHLGHGYSVNEETPLYGYFSKENSPELLIEDVHSITLKAQTAYPNLPYFIMGHSMGSFVVRNYLKNYSKLVDGAIIMGTGGRRPELRAALTVTALLNKKHPTALNKKIDALAFGNFYKAFPEKRTPMDWLSKNKQNVDEYLEDPLLGFTFTNNGFDTLFQLTASANEKGWYNRINHDLPILFTSGEKDPVGNFGKGVIQVTEEMVSDGFDAVTLQLYPDLRHEILNEDEKDLIQSDILNWINHQLPK
ncbi:alpha/beta fold hydrolase [Vagococcus fessus]|uniref:alpha/beta fold hydrolase n=1 Tax=Vagococcus fessus TaxID=120370 RepID=UPI000F864521|nr:alpha/beta fold hydrolase [Vagococcus fessus]